MDITMHFAKDQMFDELRTIFLFEADHILLGRGDEVADEFIGFGTGAHREYCMEDPSKVDLSRFSITGSFDRGYDYAFTPSVMNALDESEVQDLIVFMEGTPRVGGIASGGERHSFMTPEGYCRRVADTVQARWKLEWEERDSSWIFTTRELALLANMTEGAVRNAIADKSEHGLSAIPGSKPVSVGIEEAWRWLNLRRGFVPTPTRPREDRFLEQHLREMTTAEELGSFLRRRAVRTFHSVEKAAAVLGWPPDQFEKWEKGRFRFNEPEALRLSEVFDLDAPLFAGKALEVTLRRDSERGAE